jgi:hypothetical protein
MLDWGTHNLAHGQNRCGNQGWGWFQNQPNHLKLALEPEKQRLRNVEQTWGQIGLPSFLDLLPASNQILMNDRALLALRALGTPQLLLAHL